jgi:hypothetical protein
MLGVQLLDMPVLELELLMLFSLGSDVGVLFRGDTDGAGKNFVGDYSLAVLAYDVNAEFLGWDVSRDLKR